MKLVIATPLYPPEPGGPATDAAMLEAGLPAHSIEPIMVPFAKVRHLPSGVRHLRYMLDVFKASRGACAVVALDTFSVAVPAFVAACLRAKPFVLRVPGDYAWEQGRQRFGVADGLDVFQTKRYGFQVEFLRSVQRFIARRAALVLVPSDYFKRIVTTWGVRPERLVRTYLGADLHGESVIPSEVPSGKILLSAGRLVAGKGFAALIKALKGLSPEWQLVIVGDGPDRAMLEKLAREAGVAARVIFIGFLPHAKVLGWLQTADAFVLNTASESFSFQVLEAMASGTPVIATNVGALPELIDNGAEGVLYDPDDAEALTSAVESVVLRPDEWKLRTEAAVQKAARFSADAAVQAFIIEMKNVCA